MDELTEDVCPVCGVKPDVPLAARVVGCLVVASLGLLSVALVLFVVVRLVRWTF